MTCGKKCPWDKKQTIQTLRQLTIEETYDWPMPSPIMIGKLLRKRSATCYYTLYFMAKIGTEQNQFTLLKRSTVFVINWWLVILNIYCRYEGK